MKLRKLEILRGKMKEKDKEIIRLLNERSQISVQIGKVKGDGGIQVYDPAQEAKVYNYLQELNSGPLRPAAVKAIFREIVSASRDLQRPTTIAFLDRKPHFLIWYPNGISGSPAVFFPRMELPGFSMKWKKVRWIGV